MAIRHAGEGCQCTRTVAECLMSLACLDPLARADIWRRMTMKLRARNERFRAPTTTFITAPVTTSLRPSLNCVHSRFSG
ncbi:uncharacterized protein YALI1_B01334g [Yarrowia lipolytica]|uniref:Uncharacterized protein n=1 Tax=Yarrowia lipolytica TaxID=4952 RepID=A0A1D8N5W9_YARLL|nr:hypothetical protein YALI1_B01334g [Yarrowia lipolytica]